MTLILENGTGVHSANAYADETFVTAYLTDRGRQSQNSWDTATDAAKDAAIIAATDYIEQRFGPRFKGNKEFYNMLVARATLTMTQQPADTETVTLGTVVYTFNTVLGAANSVLIGDTLSDSLLNLKNAVTANSEAEGTTHGTGTVENDDATVVELSGQRLLASAKVNGENGNEVSVATTVTNASWNFNTLVGGSDTGINQGLSFPRANMFDNDGLIVREIPNNLKQAVAEYAVRALSATLMPDPTVQDSGQVLKEDFTKVGPIETRKVFQDGSVTPSILKSYPAADRMLSDYLQASGVFR
jgi:hypothetical protein